ncbi:MAG TPA: hypothetical protein VKN18_00170 [Blastocatellia bacterium]|nr:hypothetical protein [Blastocatellia bacterium]
MGEVELHTIRKMLQRALQNLGDDIAGADFDGAPIAVVSGATDSIDASGTPIIVVVASDPTLRQGSRASNQSMQTLNTVPSESVCKERKVSHAGLERFTIEGGTQTSAPKSCFMEPDRPCVNSGACEMRGY